MHIKSFRPLTLAGIALAVLGAFIALSLAPAPSAEAQVSNPVRNLTLTQTSLDSFTATWDAPASGNAQWYQVRLGTADLGNINRDINYDGSRSKTFSISGLGLLYNKSYTVSVDWSNGSRFGHRTSATIILSDGRPENLTLTRLSDKALSVSWDPPIVPKEAPEFYRVVAYDADGYEGHSARWLGSDVREYRLTGMDSELEWTIHVHALQSRNSAPSAPARLNVTTLATPGAVADLSAEAIVNGLEVSWTERPESESIFMYELQYTTDGSDYGRSYQGFEGSQTINSLTAGQEYTVRVRSCGYSQIAGDGPFCSAWSETTGTPEAASTALLDAPSPPQNLQLSIVDGNRLRVNWDEPASGWEPAEMLAADSDYGFKYVVTLQNEEDAKTVWKRPGYKKPWAVFRNLEEGATYKASVQAIIRDAQRVKNDREDHNSHWVKSEWVSATVTVPEEGEGGESPGGGIGTEPYRLVWVQLAAGEPTPPNAVGEPTRHVRAVPGTADYERFDPVAECIAADGGGAVSFQQSAVDTVEEIYNKWQDLADANPGVQYFADEAAKRKADLDAARAKLDEVKAKLATDCEAKFPPENLTQDDVRWVQVPAPLEKVDDED